MFNDLGKLVPGVKKTFLFVSVDIPETDSLKSIEFRFPDCQEWAGSNLHHCMARKSTRSQLGS